MADEQQVLQEAAKLPLSEQIAHTSWKARAQALSTIQQKLSRAFSCEDEIFSEAGPLLAKAAGDSNANVMDKAVETLVTFLEKADEALAARIAGPVSTVLASKCLKGKPATVGRATEACMLLIELEQQAAVVEPLLKAFTDKVPKVVLAAVDIILQAISAFGARTLDAKPIMKALPALYGHTQAGVRDKAKEASVELAAYLGAGVVAGVLLDKMPAAMRKDVDAAIEQLPPGRKQPGRFTRKEAAERAAREGEGGAEEMEVDGEPGAAGGGGAAAPEEEQEGDPYEYAAPVDVLGPLGKAQLTVDDDPPMPFWEALEAKKWGLRKAALDKAKELASAPRLASGDYGDLVRLLRKILQKDSMIAVAAAAADVAAALAQGLRAEFSAHAKSLCPCLLERFKEKNIVMSKAAEEGLRVLARHCFTLLDVAEDVAAALDHKNPKVKRETAKLVRDVLEHTPKPVALKLRDSVLPAVAKLADAGDNEVREAAQAALVAFAVRAGSMGILDKVMEKLDDVRKKKIEDMVTEAIAKAPKGGGGGGSAPAKPGGSGGAAAGRPPPSRTASTASGGASTSRPGTARSSPKALAPKNGVRPGAGAAAGKAGVGLRRAASSGVVTRSKAGGGGTAAPAEEDLSSGKLSNEELEARMVETFGEGTVELLRSAKWQERVEAMGSVLSAVQEMGDPGPRCYELVQCVAFLPGWGEKNFQVLNKQFEVVTHLAGCAAFGKRDAAAALGGLVDKIHELKHKMQVCAALTAMSEAVGPQFVTAELHKRAAANKNPKVLAEALGWIAEAVPEFGLGVMDVKGIIEWMKADLGSANAPVRNKAMEVLGRCHAQLGPSLLSFLEGLKPAQLTALEEHFRQNPQTEVIPTRKVRSKKKGGGSAAAGPVAAARGPAAAGEAFEEEEEEAEGASLNPDDLLPRTDISCGVTPSLLAMLGSSNWKERNAGVDAVAALLAEANHRIEPHVGELFPALKARLTDSNRNLAAKVLQLLGDIARAMGPPFDRGARPPLLFPAVANLSDNKKQVRDGVLYMLDAWIAVAAADKLFPAVAEAVANPKCIADGKIAALQWLTKVVAEGKGRPGADSALRAAAIGMQDKAASVREVAAALLSEMVAALGQEAVSAAAGQLMSADRKAAQEALNKVLGPAAAAAPAVAAAAAARPTSAPAPRAPTARAGARPATSRPGTAARGTPAALPPAAAVEPAAAGPILVYSDGKAERARKYRPRPGKFEGVPPEEAEVLQRELTAVASPEWGALLFSKDFKRHLEAAEQLVASLDSALEEVQASLDLVLRWAVLRICDGNMQSLVRVLEMLRALLEALSRVGYRMSEYEALLLLPAVVEKAGHNQDRVRGLHRDVLRLACELQPSQRVVDNLVVGLASKSNRTKIECCEELACIVEREGMGPLLGARSRPLQALAAALKERDGATRAAALLAIEAAWVEEGEGVWKLLGRLDHREADMVQEKLRRSSKTPKVQPEAPAAAAPSSAQRTRPGAFVPREPALGGTPVVDPDDAALGYQQPQYSDGPQLQYSRQAFTPPAALATPLPPRPATAAYAANAAAAAAPTPVPGMRPFTAPGAAPLPPPAVDDVEFDARWAEGLAGVAADNVEEAVEHMKLMCGDIMLCLQGAATPHMLAVMGQSADRLFSTVNQQLLRVFAAAEASAAAGGGQPPSRGAKYALNVMLQGMNVPSIAAGLTQATLRDSISLLLLRLLDDGGLLHYEEGATLVKAVNVLMLKILEASNRTYAFAALLQLLREPPPGVPPEALPKFYDLVVKCLIKLTKGLQGGMQGVDLDGLLFCLHDFFLFLGVDEIRRRSSSDDKPLRMVKTILHELCKLLGYDIYLHADAIPGRDADPQPIIFAYISLNLQTLSQSGVIAPPAGSSNGQPRSAAATPSAASRSPASSEAGEVPPGGGGQPAAAAAAAAALSEGQKAELKGRLKDVMSRLMQRDQSAAAMQELYIMRKQHPAFVERYVATTSDMFRNFIDGGLAALKAAEQGGGGGAQPAPQPQQQQQQQPEAAAPPPRRPAAVPPLELQRPPLSPPGADPRAGVAMHSPGAPTPTGAQSPGGLGAGGAARMASLRDRMNLMRLSGGDGGGGGGGGSLPASGRSSSGANLAEMGNSLELQSLQQRLANLQSRRTSQT